MKLKKSLFAICIFSCTAITAQQAGFNVLEKDYDISRKAKKGYLRAPHRSLRPRACGAVAPRSSIRRAPRAAPGRRSTAGAAARAARPPTAPSPTRSCRRPAHPPAAGGAAT